MRGLDLATTSTKKESNRSDDSSSVCKGFSLPYKQEGRHMAARNLDRPASITG